MDDTEYKQSVEWLVERARVDFLTYVALCRIDPKFCLGDLHRFLIGLVQGVVDGKLGKRHAVSVPPQHGKSTMLSIEAASWLVGRFPERQVAITGYSYGLTTSFSKAVRDRVQSPLYQMVFPKATLRKDQGQADNWLLTNGSGVIAKSVGSKLTGRKVDWLIIDDPHAGRAEAESEVQREKVKQWYFGDCVTRLSPDASTFIIGTRFHPHDLIGTLTDSDYVEGLQAEGADDEVFHVTNLQAVAEPDDPLGRAPGEPLFPEVRHSRFLNAVRATIPAYEWSSQYQGKPQVGSTNIIDVSKLAYVEEDEVPWDQLEMTRGWDLALTEKQTSDWSSGALVGRVLPDKELVDAARKEGLPPPLPDFYILGMFRDKLNWTKLKSRIVAISLADLDEYGIARIGMEAVSGFEVARLEAKQALMGKVIVEKRNPKNQGKRNQSSKLMRAQPWINLVEAGRVFVLRGKWNKDLIAEMLTFPDGAHDDQIDGITIGYETLFFKHSLLLG
jgi:predicted phage terminase large subunit-like protein